MSVKKDGSESDPAGRTAIFLHRLVSSGAISDSQADLLIHGWLDLENWPSHPWFQNVGEHTQAALARFRRENPR